jgi:nitrogen regulatory protein PII
MMKVVVAYVDTDRFEAIRKDLVACGITHASAIAAGGVTENSGHEFVAPHYKGSNQTKYLGEKIRVEIVVGASHVEDAKRVIFDHVGKRSFLYVMTVDEAMPIDLVAEDTAAAAS